MALSTTITARVRAELTGTLDQGSRRASLALEKALVLATGTGSGQAEKVFSDQRILSASATEDLDLTNLTDPFGVALSFATVKAILVVAATGNTNNVLIGGAASAQFLGPLEHSSDKVNVKPGGVALFVAPGTGWTVTNSSLDLLRMGNSAGGTSVTYDIMIIGT